MFAGVEGLDLHHLYRAMAWLGEELSAKEQDGRTPFAPRCLKDVMEDRLFAHRRDLFTRLDLVFMDTTSLYFEGAGGQTLGQHGYSKDHRPDLKQMILAVLLDGDGRPVCSEMWPGNTADVTTVIPVVDRLRPARSSITARQPVSSHNRSNTNPGPMRRTAILIAASSATALSIIALAANRAPERNRRSSWPLACKSPKRPSVAITCWRTWSPSRRLSTICR